MCGYEMGMSVEVAAADDDDGDGGVQIHHLQMSQQTRKIDLGQVYRV